MTYIKTPQGMFEHTADILLDEFEPKAIFDMIWCTPAEDRLREMAGYK